MPMYLLKRVLRLAVSAALSTTALSAGVSSQHIDKTQFASCLEQTPPQRAQGDFDGDGRVDTAQIEQRAGAGRISIRLSGSSAPVDLEPSVIGVVQGDVDHDGDLDLVAATSAGDLLVWINDGHGRFTRQPASPTRGVSGEPAAAETASHSLLVVSVRTSALPSPAQHEIGLAVAPLRSSPSRSVDDVPDVALPPLRAPPGRSV